MKKWFYLLIVVCIAISFVGCSSPLPPSPVEDFSFEEVDGTITIKEYIGSDEHVVVPETINNKPVTRIDVYAFFFANAKNKEQNKELKSVVLPDTVTHIGNAAFDHCEALTSVTLPKNLEEIGSAAFSHCKKLSGVVLPNSLKKIGAGVFENCESLKEIVIPSNISFIPIGVFQNSGLEKLTLKEGVTHIGSSCFARTNIKKLVLPKTVQVIDVSAFAACEKLTTVRLNKELQEIDIGAFEGCEKLTAIQLYEGLQKIGSDAFAGTNLKEIVIPSTVTEIWDTTFSGCSKLNKIKFEGNAPNDFLITNGNDRVEPYDVHFTIYYHKNATGFTSPEWHGYPTAIW